MTKREALALNVKSLGLDAQLLEKALIDAGIDGESDYTQSDKKLLFQAEYDLLSSPLIVESESQGGYTIKYYTAGITNRLKFLEQALGFTNEATPTIRSVTNLW